MLITENTLTWQDVLAEEKRQDYFKALMERLKEARCQGKTIYPRAEDCFRAFRTPFDQVRVVILGQDPYHGPRQAHGLCFSVQPGVPAPPSLQNIFKELANDCGIQPPNHGCLTHWADQGVLLLNTTLTVERGQPQSHAKWGWQTFTDRVIERLSTHHQGLVFLLWGAPAQRKGHLVNPQRHHLLKAPHPSPLSAHRGFLGCKHFSTCNALLEAQGLTPIDWALPPITE